MFTYMKHADFILYGESAFGAWIYYFSDKLIKVVIRSMDASNSYIETFSSLERLEEDVVDTIKDGAWLEWGDLQNYINCDDCGVLLPCEEVIYPEEDWALCETCYDACKEDFEYDDSD